MENYSLKDFTLIDWTGQQYSKNYIFKRISNIYLYLFKTNKLTKNMSMYQHLI